MNATREAAEARACMGPTAKEFNETLRCDLLEAGSLENFHR